MNTWEIKLTDRYGRFHYLPRFKDGYRADPFIKDGYIFCEQYDREKGVIAVTTLEPPHEFSVIIEEDYHVSFPHVFSAFQNHYMVVESLQNQTIDLYKAKEFPYVWEKYQTLMVGVSPADPQIFEYELDFYLFFTNGNDDFLEVWKFNHFYDKPKLVHKGEYKYSRSAGRVYEKDGKLYRPVQVNEPHYGAGIMIKEITLPEYTEKVVGEIYPTDEGSIGIHTIDFDEFYTITDHKYET